MSRQLTHLISDIMLIIVKNMIHQRYTLFGFIAGNNFTRLEGNIVTQV